MSKRQLYPKLSVDNKCVNRVSYQPNVYTHTRARGPNFLTAVETTPSSELNTWLTALLFDQHMCHILFFIMVVSKIFGFSCPELSQCFCRQHYQNTWWLPGSGNRCPKSDCVQEKKLDLSSHVKWTWGKICQPKQVSL